ncbi:MAG TPA: FKBP-type peptidyl-prolyl cis-trans isomerase [Longimicrobium sp.]|nr:FKBP-type peptidyl-prolyl cis-trans isomerase [Longimicrobium sp.]
MHRFLMLALLSLLASGCTPPPPPPAPPTAITFAPDLQVNLSAMQVTTTGVYYRDLVVGEGPLVRYRRRVGVHLAGFLPDGTQFQQVALPSPPMEFELGLGDVIRGLEAGMIGMRPGGQRQLVIPPSQGYGVRRVGQVPPNSTLVFVVKLVSIQ